jgi:4-hydroxybenzoate polyprenyltransferase
VAEAAEEAAVENKQGLTMIAIGILVTGIIIGILGLMAENGRLYVIGMAVILLMIGSRIYLKAKTSKK